MNKLFFAIPVLLLCACTHKQAVVQPVVGVSSVQIELSNSRKLEALPCSDDLDCFQKVTGYCHNGYTGGSVLQAEGQRRVGIAFQCITDEQKAAMAAREVTMAAQEKEWEQLQKQRLQQLKDEVKKPAKKTSPKK